MEATSLFISKLNSYHHKNQCTKLKIDINNETKIIYEFYQFSKQLLVELISNEENMTAKIKYIETLPVYFRKNLTQLLSEIQEYLEFTQLNEFLNADRSFLAVQWVNKSMKLFYTLFHKLTFTNQNNKLIFDIIGIVPSKGSEEIFIDKKGKYNY